MTTNERLIALRAEQEGYLTAIESLQNRLNKVNEAIEKFEKEPSQEPEFAGPYTLENRPQDQERVALLQVSTKDNGLLCTFAIYYNGRFRAELSRGWIFPDTPAGRAKAEAVAARGLVQMYAAEPALTEMPEDVRRYLYADHDWVATDPIGMDADEMRIKDHRAFPFTPGGALGAFLRSQELKVVSND